MLLPPNTVVRQSDRDGDPNRSVIATPTCRDEILAAVMALTERDSGDTFTGGQIFNEMLAAGSGYSKSTALKTMQRMKEPPARPPYARLERVGSSGFRLAKGGCDYDGAVAKTLISFEP